MKRKYTDEERKEVKRLRAKARYHKNKNTEHAKAIKKRYRDSHKEAIKKLQQAYYINNKETLNEYTKTYAQSPKGKYSQYKESAKKRKIDFNLTLEEFTYYWQQNCSYCNSAIETIGIDRIDSNKGYEKENILSCCTKCNQMKLNYPTEFFLSQVHNILNFTKNPIYRFDCIIFNKKGVPSKHTKAKSVSKDKGREFDLSKKQFMDMQRTSCAYCGSDENIGVDRIDSNKGYIEGNCTSCCPICNKMKMDQSLSDFYLHLLKIDEQQHINKNKEV